MQNLSTKDAFAKVLLPVPSLEAQARVVDLLDHVDVVEEKRVSAMESLSETASSLFSSMFEGTLSHGWDTVQLDSIISRTQLGLVRSAAQFGPGFETPYVRMNAITRGGELDKSLVQRTQASQDEIRGYSLNDGDVLFNTRNSRSLVGKSALVRGDYAAVFNNNVMRIALGPQVHPVYFMHYLHSADGVRQLDRIKSGTTSVFAIYWKDLRLVRIPVPPKDLQEKFSNLEECIVKSTASMRHYLGDLEALRASIEERSFSGAL